MFIIVISTIFIILAAIVICGYGDDIIAGYNTASKEEKGKYNIKRLRILVAAFLFITSLAMIFFLYGADTERKRIFHFIFIPLLISLFVLKSTWAKNKE